MKINLSKAIKAFYPNPSFEQIYFEALANALDAGARKVAISIVLEAFDKTDTLKVSIIDDGHGFTDANFQKFSSLLEVDSNDHKGLGRLVYLAYFREVAFDSRYGQSKRRAFTFNSDFKGESVVTDEEGASGTRIEYKYFSGEKVKSYAYLSPDKIKESILEHFFPLFFKLKEKGEKLEIEISLDVTVPNPDQEFVPGKVVLSLSELPQMETSTIQDASLDFFQKIDIHHSFKSDRTKPRSIITAISVDGRAINCDLIPIDAIPHGYQILFIFSSDFFVGKTNSSRQRLELPDEVTEKNLRTTLKKEAARIIAEKIPAVVEENQRTEKELDAKFPHLAGYYPKDTPGLIIKNTALDEAQKAFFNEQKKILECDTLNDARYAKAIELSARALMEYVLYRARIIEKLSSMNPASSETEIHSLIVPMKKSYKGDALVEDIYNNNVWMLDDKYMSYNVVLSDKTMTEVLREIALEEVEDEGRPDVTLVFSGDPEKSVKVDVVVVELKKREVGLAKKEEVVSQLRQRARRLLRHYPDKIERIWFYGITDIDQEFRRSLKEDQFKELFSHGQMFHKPQQVIVDDEDKPFLVDLFVLTYEAFIKDAESRNSTFIRILRSRISSFLASTPESLEVQ